MNEKFFQERTGGIYRLAQALMENKSNIDLPGPVVGIISHMLGFIADNAVSFDNICFFTIRLHGGDFDIYISDQFHKENIRSQDHIEYVLQATYDVMSEFYFQKGSGDSHDWNRIRDVIANHKDQMREHVRYWIEKTDNRLSAELVRSYFHEFKSLKLDEIRKVKDDWDASKTSWDKDIAQKEISVNRLRESLVRAEKGYNFVGLVRGFRHLRKQKESEQCWSFVGLWLLAFLLCVLPAVSWLDTHGFKAFGMEEKGGTVQSSQHGAAASKTEFSPTPSVAGKAQAKTEPDSAVPHVTSAQNAGGDTKTIAQPSSIWLVLLKLLPLLTLEIIVLYFFRIVLAQYRSVKAQMLQLDLRMALCQFIESYTKHMVKVKKDAPDVLQKFESLIFSGLMTDGEKIPSVLDGTEQLAHLIRSVRD